MMNVGIVTLNGNDNYGNKLQHYAVQTYLEKYNNKVETINFLYYNRLEYRLKHFIKFLTRRRYRSFCNFDKKIKYCSKKIFYKKKLVVPTSINNKYDSFFVGSDQVWNSSIKTFGNQYLLSFIDNNNKKNSFSASFGINDVPKKDEELFKKELSQFKSISVREERGKEIVEKLTGRKDIEVLVDPTMLLTSAEWDKVAKKPKDLYCDRYIVNYFLGEIPKNVKEEIERIASENNCKIINLLDINEQLYSSGPSEFLYLEKNAFLICTDSFHASVFAILYNRPFIVFDRVQDGIECINSRIETLINKFELQNRRYNGEKITKENLDCDYSNINKILEMERNRANVFLQKILDKKN